MLLFAAIVLILLAASMGVAMAWRMRLRRRGNRVLASFPEHTLAGPALLAGVNDDESLTGLGTLVLTRQEVVFAFDRDRVALRLPRSAVRAGEHHHEGRRGSSLRLMANGRIAQFEVERPTPQQWVDAINAALW